MSPPAVALDKDAVSFAQLVSTDQRLIFSNVTIHCQIRIVSLLAGRESTVRVLDAFTSATFATGSARVAV